MSLKPSNNMMIPADTFQVARSIFPKGDNLWIKMRDELGSIFDDEQQGLTLAQHLVDGAYTSSDLVITSQQEHSIDLVGPLKPGSCWQARTEGAFEVHAFAINW